MMPRKTRKSNPKEESKRPQKDDVDSVVGGLTDNLGELTQNLIRQTQKFFESVNTLNLAERVKPNLEVVGALAAKHDEITRTFGDKVAKLKEGDLLSFKEVSAISGDLVERIGLFRLDLDKIDDHEKEMVGLIGIPGSQGTSFDSLVTQYMGQIQVLGDIATKFAVKVQTCEACMDVEKYETLIKSLEDILTLWLGLLKGVEDLLNSKKDLLYNLAKD